MFARRKAFCAFAAALLLLILNIAVLLGVPSSARATSEALQLKIVKEVIGAPPASDWNFSLVRTGGNSESFRIRATGGYYEKSIAPGTYTIAETVLDGWGTSVSCVGGSSATGSNRVTITVSSNTTCTFTNRNKSNAGPVEDPATLTISAETDPSDAIAFRVEVRSVAAIRSWGRKGSGLAQFNTPESVAVSGDGYVYIADTGNCRVQKFDVYGRFLTEWGGCGNADGRFSQPTGVAVSERGDVYVADWGNHRVQRFDSFGRYLGKWGSSGNQRGQFQHPRAVVVDHSGNVYVADNLAQIDRVQKFDANGQFLAEWGLSAGENAAINEPQGMAIDGAGHLYVSISGNDHIQKLDSNGKHLTQWGSSGSGNGQFNNVRGVAVDDVGNVYVADSGNGRIQKFDSNGQLLTEWPLDDAVLAVPFAVATDLAGSFYVLDEPITQPTVKKLFDVEELLGDGEATTYKLEPAAYRIQLVAPPGWTIAPINCDGGNPQVSEDGLTATIDLASGDEVACALSGTYQRPVSISDRYDVVKDEEIFVSIPGVLTNDTTASGDPRAYYLGYSSDQWAQILEMAWRDNDWHYQNITSAAINSSGASAPLPVGNRFVTTSVNGEPRVYYMARTLGGDHIHELSWNEEEKRWAWQDITVQTNGPAVAELSSLSSVTVNGNPRIYYLAPSENGLHIHELAWFADAWHHRDVTRFAVAPPSAPGGGLAAITIINGDPRVYYVGLDRNVHELVWRTLGQAWSHRNLTANIGGPVVARNSLGVTTVGYDRGSPRIYYSGEDSHIHELAWVADDWSYSDVTNRVLAEANVSPANVDLDAVVFAATSVGTNGDPRVYYVGSDHHIHELAWAAGKWHYRNVTSGMTESSPVAPMGTADTLSAITVGVDLAPRVYYLGVDGLVHELAWATNQWNYSKALDPNVGEPLIAPFGPLRVTTGSDRVLTANLVSDVTRGTLSLDKAGSFLYTPAADFQGEDRFTYVANDGAYNSQAVTVTLSVSEPRESCPPVPDNLVANPCFEVGTAPWEFSAFKVGTTPWDFPPASGHYFTTAVNPFSGEFAAEVESVERLSGFHLKQAGLVLQPNTSYELSFAAYSKTGRGMAVWVLKNATSSDRDGWVFVVDLSQHWKVYTLNFQTPSEPEMNNALLRFAIQPYDASDNVYHIDQVVLRPVGGAALPTAPQSQAPPVPPQGHCSNPVTGNLLRNPGFETGSADWRFWSKSFGSFRTASKDQYECISSAQVTVLMPGKRVQLYQKGFLIKPNTTYRLRLAGRSSTGEDLSLYVHRHTDPYNDYGLRGLRLDLKPDWQVFVVQFTTDSFGEATTDARLRLWLVTQNPTGANFEIDDVVLLER